MSRRVTGALVATLAAGAMVGGPVAVASASDMMIKSEIVHAGPRLHRDGLRILAAFKRYSRTHRAGPVVRAIRAQDTDYLRLRTRLDRTSASTHNGTLGKREIVHGMTLIVRSNRTIADALHRHGNVGLTPTEFKRAERLSKRGDRYIQRGVRLLNHG